MRILFWGTPEFALPTLRALAATGREVAGVVTRPDRPRGRGRKVQPSPVKRFAQARGWPVLAPESPREPAFVDALREIAPCVSVVVAYGRILPRRVLELPALGSVNVHASLLPALRGAAPVAWAIARGRRRTGVTVMRMVEEMDAGPVLAQRALRIDPGDTGTSLSQRLSEVGARLLAETLDGLAAGSAHEEEQDHAAATYAPKVDRNAARVDWSRDAGAVADLIRAMDDAPGAWTLLDGQPVKVFGAAAADGVAGRGGDDAPVGAASLPGRILVADSRRGLFVQVGGGAGLRIAEVQPPGKRRMAATDWVRGRGVRAGERFE